TTPSYTRPSLPPFTPLRSSLMDYQLVDCASIHGTHRTFTRDKPTHHIGLSFYFIFISRRLLSFLYTSHLWSPTDCGRLVKVLLLLNLSRQLAEAKARPAHVVE